MMQKFGKFIQIDLRTAFKDEARDFTPWLAHEDNIELLSEALLIDLDNPRIEQSVGSFSADIVCENTDGLVIIENQLDQTDHKHLGQIITYASGKTAKTIIWICKKIRQEHEAAIDWLNHISDESINFFAVEVELWKIGDSEIAPRFNVVARPNEWVKMEQRTSRSNCATTDLKRAQLAYWTSLNELVTKNGKHLKARSGGAQHWQNYSIGKSGYTVTALVNTQKMLITAQFEMNRDSDKSQYENLFAQKNAIENEIGYPLIWERLEGRKTSKISINYKCDPLDEQNWPKQHKWLLSTLEDLWRVFNPLIKNF